MATDQARIRITAENQTKAAFESVKASMAGVQTAASKLNGALAAIGVGLSVGTIAGMAREFIGAAAALDGLSQKTGSTIENLSGLQNIAKLSGQDFGQVTDVLVRMSKALAGSGRDDETKGVGAALKAIGLNADELRQKDPSQALRAIAVELNKYADSGGKAALVESLLGKGAAALLPYLKDLATEVSRAAVVTAEQATQADNLEKALRRLTVESAATKQQFSLALVPALNDLIERFNAATRSAGGFFSGLAVFATTNSFGDVGKSIADLERRLDGLSKIRKFGNIQGGLEKLLADGQQKNLEQRLKFLKEVQKQELVNSDLAKQLGDPLSSGPRRQLDFKIPEAPKGGGGTSPFDAAVKSLEQEAIKVDNLSRRFEILRGIQQGLYGVLTPLQAKRLDDLASEVDKTRELQAVAKADLEARAQLQKIAESNNKLAADAIANLQDEREAMTQTTKVAEVLRNIERGRYGEINAGTSERLQSIAREIDAQRELMKARQEDIEAQKYLAAEVEKLNKPSKTQEEIFQKLASSFEDAITSGSKLRDVLRGLGQDLLKIFIRQQITEPLGKASQPLFNSIGSGIGEIFAGLFRAEGGPVSARSPYIVGERGPELFVPNSSGTIIPNNKLAAGGGVTVVQNISFGSDVNRSTMGAWAQQIKRETMAAVADQVQRGGAYASAFR